MTYCYDQYYSTISPIDEDTKGPIQSTSESENDNAELIVLLPRKEEKNKQKIVTIVLNAYAKMREKINQSCVSNKKKFLLPLVSTHY